MSRRALFKEADLARALKAVQGAGVAVGRVEIDPDGKIVIVSRVPSQNEDDEREAGRARLEVLRESLKRDGFKRPQRASPRQAQNT